MTREGALAEKYVSRSELINKIYNDFDARLKSKDEEIKRLKEVIDTSIEEIEYSIKKPQYAEVYLGNAIRLLKDAK